MQNANSQENEQNIIENKNDNTRTSIYFHPAALITGAANDALLLFSTIEAPINLFRSVIIKPSICYISGYNEYAYDFDLHLEDPIRIGTDVGMRFYPGEKGDGLYLQTQIGLFVVFAKEYTWGYNEYYDLKFKRTNKFWLDVMGYIGYAKKYSRFSVSIDAGVGLEFIAMKRELIGDVNLSIGFPLNKKKY
ncbi:MAG: hypothetical protein FWG85_05920 [Bacteroidetes bacterium]|nr:hypothetical protein [Bacteroidota bacterium]